MVSQILNQLDCYHSSTKKFALKFNPEDISKLPTIDAKSKLIEMFFTLSECIFENYEPKNND
jgi:hypothetical protein